MSEQKNLRMPDLNKIMIAGTITRDPEITHLQSGTALCKFSLANNKRWTDKSSGEKKEETCFISVTSWGKTAEYVAEHMKVGYPVLIEGRLTMSEWEDRDTGQKRTRHEISATNIQQLSWNNAKKSSGDAPKQREIEEPESDSLPF